MKGGLSEGNFIPALCNASSASLTFVEQCPLNQENPI